MSQFSSTVLLSCGLTVGLYMAPPPPGPMGRKSPGRFADAALATAVDSRKITTVRAIEFVMALRYWNDDCAKTLVTGWGSPPEFFWPAAERPRRQESLSILPACTKNSR